MVKHWLPTKEYGLVNDFLLEGGVIPENLSLRPSGYKFNGKPPEFKGKFHMMEDLPTSTATYLDENSKPEVVHGHLCPCPLAEWRVWRMSCMLEQGGKQRHVCKSKTKNQGVRHGTNTN